MAGVSNRGLATILGVTEGAVRKARSGRLKGAVLTDGSSAPFDAYAFTEFNFVMGETFKPLTIPRVNLPSGPGAFANGSDVYLLAGIYLGYKQKTSNAWATTIPASGGRAARASIPRLVFE